MAARLKGRVAEITGAASGIGAACAGRFAGEGAVIAGLDVQKPVDDGWDAVLSASPESSFREGLAVREESDKEWVIARFVGKTKQGNMVKDLPLALVVVGKAAE